jgi:hypothetical protein
LIAPAQRLNPVVQHGRLQAISEHRALDKSPVPPVTVGAPSTSFNQHGDPDHFNHDTDRHGDEQGNFFRRCLTKNQMVLAQRFTGTKRGRAAEAVRIRNPVEALAEPTDNIV